MTRGKNYLYNIQGKEVPYYTHRKLLEHKPSYTFRMYSISKMRINIFLNCTSTKLKSRTRIKFGAEMLQGCIQDDVF